MPTTKFPFTITFASEVSSYSLYTPVVPVFLNLSQELKKKKEKRLKRKSKGNGRHALFRPAVTAVQCVKKTFRGYIKFLTHNCLNHLRHVNSV